MRYAPESTRKRYVLGALGLTEEGAMATPRHAFMCQGCGYTELDAVSPKTSNYVGFREQNSGSPMMRLRPIGFEENAGYGIRKRAKTGA